MTRQIQNRPRTPEEEKVLKTLLEEGKSVPFVAARLKRSMMTIKTRANKVGVSFKQIKIRMKARK
jgi:DNA-binding NarL/FixJ family response regulator